MITMMKRNMAMKKKERVMMITMTRKKEMTMRKTNLPLAKEEHPQMAMELHQKERNELRPQIINKNIEYFGKTLVYIRD